MKKKEKNNISTKMKQRPTDVRIYGTNGTHFTAVKGVRCQNYSNGCIRFRVHDMNEKKEKGEKKGIKSNSGKQTNGKSWKSN